MMMMISFPAFYLGFFIGIFRDSHGPLDQEQRLRALVSERAQAVN